MLPGDLFRLVRQRMRPGADPLRLRVAPASHDHTVPALWYGEEEVCSWPRGEVPATSIFTYVCVRCGDAGTDRFQCHKGEPPAGIERRGLEFLQEPGTCGHNVERRLVARGVDALLTNLSGWRDERGCWVWK